MSEIDTDALGALLIKIEQRHERAGWHTDAEFWAYVVYETGSAAAEPIERTMGSVGPPVRTARYCAQPMLAPRMLAVARETGEEKPTTTFRRYAGNLAYAKSDQEPHLVQLGLAWLRSMLQTPDVVGFVTCCEAFSSNDASKFRSLFSGTLGHLGDALSSVESRFAVMIDRDDRTHCVNRAAGECSELHLDIELGGDTVSSLRMIMDLAADRLPSDQPGFDERYPSSVAVARTRGLL